MFAQDLKPSQVYHLQRTPPLTSPSQIDTAASNYGALAAWSLKHWRFGKFEITYIAADWPKHGLGI